MDVRAGADMLHAVAGGDAQIGLVSEEGQQVWTAEAGQLWICLEESRSGFVLVTVYIPVTDVV